MIKVYSYQRTASHPTWDSFFVDDNGHLWILDAAKKQAAVFAKDSWECAVEEPASVKTSGR